jgi:hypothetical protein
MQAMTNSKITPINLLIKTKPSSLPKFTLAESNKKSSSIKENTIPVAMEIPRNWMTMQMNDTSKFEEVRVDALHVYLPPFDRLHPDNIFLLRSAYVYTYGPTSPDFPTKLSKFLAINFEGHLEDYRINDVEANLADHLLICTNTQLHNVICASSPFFFEN